MTITLQAPVTNVALDFNAWASRFLPPVADAPVAHDREHLGMSAATMDFTGLEF